MNLTLGFFPVFLQSVQWIGCFLPLKKGGWGELLGARPSNSNSKSPSIPLFQRGKMGGKKIWGKLRI
ncbi:hypothetical protein [Luteimonas sp. R10]|uniref:hypothetical protein n=1 Tax=Luteimonas sp. R10 TaxID=3108176 RepID=UPI003088B357|nr:hypothetical protein U3649_18430 [Luteimonas sp. R10]